MQLLAILLQTAAAHAAPAAAPTMPELAEPIVITAAGAPIEAITGHAAPCMIDFDGDGRQDLLVGEFGETCGRVRVYLNVGEDAAPRFDGFTHLQAGGADATVPSASCIGFDPQFVDLDGDGNLDLLSGLYSPGAVRIFRGLGESKFAKPVLIEEVRGERAAMACANAVDFDSDGDLDLVIGDSQGRVFLNRNLGTKDAYGFGARVPLRLANGDAVKVCQKADPLPVDWDGDGRLDLLIGDEAGDVTFFRGIADEAFAAGISLFTGITHRSPTFAAVRASLGHDPVVPGFRLRLAVADWNRDGALDLLIGNCELAESGTTGQVRVLLRKQLL